jgi:hypothetical protein
MLRAVAVAAVLARVLAEQEQRQFSRHLVRQQLQ